MKFNQLRKEAMVWCYWPSVSFWIQLHVIKNHLCLNYRSNISLFFHFLCTQSTAILQRQRESFVGKRQKKRTLQSLNSVICQRHSSFRPDFVIDVFRTKKGKKRKKLTTLWGTIKVPPHWMILSMCNVFQWNGEIDFLY